MPSAKVAKATTVNPGFLASWRRAYFIAPSTHIEVPTYEVKRQIESICGWSGRLTHRVMLRRFGSRRRNMLFRPGIFFLLLSSAAAAADVGRPGLFFREDFRETPPETPVTQAHIANPDLILALYGPGKDGV